MATDEPARPTGLRESKKAATRRAIIAAALRLAKEHGLGNVRVEAIAAAAGVSPRTYNNYFSSREEAICALSIERAVQLGARLTARPPGEPLALAIRRAMTGLYAGNEPDREVILLIMSTPALAREFMKASAAGEQHFADAVADRIGAQRGRLDVAVLAAAVYAASRVATQHWLGPGRAGPFVDSLDAALSPLTPVAEALEAAGPGEPLSLAELAPAIDPREHRC
ncbi:TetR/AcrR family transcriptional regulator [Longispora albida]|uniref:TetR/AcrR family transcriptional regulator n=1 Tax=Longispora albida TaxID=203523 RepID=UPI00036C9454|nr:TetR/AcrR family transcriptional regulator [Longispora albida]